jgi:hypothetical protein
LLNSQRFTPGGEAVMFVAVGDFFEFSNKFLRIQLGTLNCPLLQAALICAAFLTH